MSDDPMANTATTDNSTASSAGSASADGGVRTQGSSCSGDSGEGDNNPEDAPSADDIFETMDEAIKLATAAEAAAEAAADQQAATSFPVFPSMPDITSSSSCSLSSATQTTASLSQLPVLATAVEMRPTVKTTCDGAENTTRLTFGKKTLAGIVISSGPGGHFETYEGNYARN
jgi:hypothetical protein